MPFRLNIALEKRGNIKMEKLIHTKQKKFKHNLMHRKLKEKIKPNKELEQNVLSKI